MVFKIFLIPVKAQVESLASSSLLANKSTPSTDAVFWQSLVRVNTRSAVRILLCAVISILSPLPCGAGSVRQAALFDASHVVMDAYNADDAEQLQRALSPAALNVNSIEQIQRAFRICRSLIGGDIVRLSLPVSGTKHYGFIAAYLQADRADMFVEIDDAGRIVYWALSKDILAGSFGCSLSLNRKSIHSSHP